MSAGGSKKAIIAALLANAGIAVAKFVGFLITRSASLLAESIHSVADTGNQGLLLLGGYKSKRADSEQHPFGYGRERYFWSFVVALVLFSLGSLFAIFEGVEKIRHPHELESPAVAIVILVLGIVLEGGSFRTAVVEARGVKGGASWPRFIRRSRNPELPVVLLEDFGALLGLGLALTAVIIATATDNARWDGIGTLTIGILLGIIAITLAVEMKSLLIGEGALPEHAAALERAVADNPDVVRLIHMRTQHLGPDELLVAAKVEFRHGLDVVELGQAIDTIETSMREAVPIDQEIYLEADRYRDEYVSPPPADPHPHHDEVPEPSGEK